MKMEGAGFFQNYNDLPDNTAHPKKTQSPKLAPAEPQISKRLFCYPVCNPEI
jgi:hypothetical protein